MRTIAYNVYNCSGWPREAAERSWAPDDEPLDVAGRIGAALADYDPTVVTFAEAPSEAVVGEVASKLEMSAQYFPGGWSGALLSTLPVREGAGAPELLPGETEDLFTRHAGRAVLDADDGEIALYSVHLHPNESATRQREIDALLDLVAEDTSEGRAVVVQGDLNHGPRGPEYGQWQDAGLTDAFAAVGDGPETTFLKDEEDETGPRDRIDYAWAGGGFGDRLASARVLSDPPFGPGDGGGSPPFLSDHLPLLVEFE